jgi:PmbA protein
MQAFVGNKMAVTRLGSSDTEIIRKAAQNCVETAKTVKDDDGNGMNESGEYTLIVKGGTDKKPDTEKLIQYTSDFVEGVGREYKTIDMRRVTTSHKSGYEVYKNSFGTTVVNPVSHYNFNVMFLAREEKKMSSFNGTGFAFKTLDTPFLNSATVRESLENCAKTINTTPFGEKKKATVIMTPDCLDSMLDGLISAFMASSSVVAKVSRWQDKIGKEVAVPEFNLRSEPLNKRIIVSPRFTNEGFVTENQTIIDNGRLVSLLPNLYTSRKTGLERAKSYGENLVVDPGNTHLKDIIKSIDTGIIMYRYSGNTISGSGEFSGLAKNSFIIKNGEIACAAEQTTVSGNIADMLLNIIAISKETESDGSYVLPYVAFKDVTIS